MHTATQPIIDDQLAQLLADLSAIQSDLLTTLTDKRARLLSADKESIAAMQSREAELIVRLQNVQERRQQLLAQAASEGLPSADLKSLAESLPAPRRQHFEPQIRDASARMRLLQHHSLTNWVLVQRTLIHLSQLLEIIATGGRQQPTYGISDTARRGGAFVDQAA